MVRIGVRVIRTFCIFQHFLLRLRTKEALNESIRRDLTMEIEKERCLAERKEWERKGYENKVASLEQSLAFQKQLNATLQGLNIKANISLKRKLSLSEGNGKIKFGFLNKVSNIMNYLSVFLKMLNFSGKTRERGSEHTNQKLFGEGVQFNSNLFNWQRIIGGKFEVARRERKVAARIG